MSKQFCISFFIFSFLFCSFRSDGADKKGTRPIDRKALVHRHFPILAKADSLSPFTAGNGEFAYTVDITGLQTFPNYYQGGIPLGTHSQWGWHTMPNPNNYAIDQTLKYYNTYGRQVPYASVQQSDAAEWLRSNPHRIHLGRIGFRIMKSDSSEIQLSDITDIHQSVDLWEGVIKSSFQVEGNEINVETACHPAIDQIAVRVKSKLLQKSSVGIRFDFPYAISSWGKNSADWDSPHKHASKIIFQNYNSAVIKRELDTTQYYVHVHWKGIAKFTPTEDHSFLLTISGENQFEFTCRFAQKNETNQNPNVRETFDASKSYWKSYWETGGAVDLSESKDPRAFELERRIVLSRYVTALQCAGSLPPQETGLMFNSWFGKFHLEMHWWHAVHFVLWGHPELLEKSLSWYETILPIAKQNAERQGYDGARWPKMVGPDGKQSPSSIGVLLIWQQPHPLYYAELMYRSRRNIATLGKYKNIVFATAEFMASFVQWDKKNNRYVLGPPLIPAQEIYKPDSTMNPAFELSYWSYGLKTAQRWRERLGLPRIEKWDHIINHLSKLPMKNGLYQNTETALNTFDEPFNRNDHPALLGSYGMLPNDSIDVHAMRRTLVQVLKSWNWETTWGWDFPFIAMTAARVGEPELAIDALLLNVQKNSYLNNGCNYQNERLPVYFPGNGGLLTAIAMMAAGWDGGSDAHAPGFPKNGNWVVHYEGLSPLP